MSRRAEVIVVTQAGPSIGGGHVSRCSALAAGFAALGAPVRFLVNGAAAEMLTGAGAVKVDESSRDEPRCLEACAENSAEPERTKVGDISLTLIEDPFGEGAGRVATEVAARGAGLCVVDSYDATPALLQEIRGACRLALVDDCRARPVEFECDALLNYNLNAASVGYRRGHAELLLGPEYALLRSDFWSLSPEEGADLLVVPGASDMLNTLGRLVEWWGEDWPRVQMVAGPLVPSAVFASLMESAEGRDNVSLVRAPGDLPARMARARAVICTSSVTSYEALALRKPLIVFQTADNQAEIGRKIARCGLGANLGEWGSWGREELLAVVRNLPSAPSPSVCPHGARNAAAALLCAPEGRGS